MQLPLPDHRSFDRFRLLRKRWRGEMDAPPWCRQCGYSMQALMKPVCPECGSDLRAVGILSPRLARFRWSFVFTPIFVVVALFFSLMLYNDFAFERVINNLPGRYVNRVSARIAYAQSATASIHVYVRGEAAPQLAMSRGPLQPIRSVRITVENNKRAEQFVVDLAQRTVESRDDFRAFDADTLKSWLGTAHEAEVTQTVMAFIESIGDGTITHSGRGDLWIEVLQKNGYGFFQIHYFCFHYNTWRGFYNIVYWPFVLLVVALASRIMLRWTGPSG